MKLNSVNLDGKIKEYEIVLTYHSDEFQKDYVVYTDNIYNKEDELQIYISEYNPENLTCTVKDITNDLEYKQVKAKINSILLTMKNESDKLENIN